MVRVTEWDEPNVTKPRRHGRGTAGLSSYMNHVWKLGVVPPAANRSPPRSQRTTSPPPPRAMLTRVSWMVLSEPFTFSANSASSFALKSRAWSREPLVAPLFAMPRRTGRRRCVRGVCHVGDRVGPGGGFLTGVQRVGLPTSLYGPYNYSRSSYHMAQTLPSLHPLFAHMMRPSTAPQHWPPALRTSSTSTSGSTTGFITRPDLTSAPLRSHPPRLSFPLGVRSLGLGGDRLLGGLARVRELLGAPRWVDRVRCGVRCGAKVDPGRGRLVWRPGSFGHDRLRQVKGRSTALGQARPGRTKEPLGFHSERMKNHHCSPPVTATRHLAPMFVG